MKNEKNPVQDYVLYRDSILKYFQCEGDFFIKPLTSLEWTIRSVDDFHFLTYWTEENKKIDAVIVKKNSVPMIHRAKEYTMIVAIDCVKIAFIFSNEHRLNNEL